MELHEAEALITYIQHRFKESIIRLEKDISDDTHLQLVAEFVKILTDLEKTLDMQLAIDYKSEDLKK